MGQHQKIKTVKFVREIRDARYEQVKNMTPEEQIAFYSSHAKRVYQNLEKRYAKNLSLFEGNIMISGLTL